MPPYKLYLQKYYVKKGDFEVKKGVILLKRISFFYQNYLT